MIAEFVLVVSVTAPIEHFKYIGHFTSCDQADLYMELHILVVQGEKLKHQISWSYYNTKRKCKLWHTRKKNQKARNPIKNPMFYIKEVRNGKNTIFS